MSFRFRTIDTDIDDVMALAEKALLEDAEDKLADSEKKLRGALNDRLVRDLELRKDLRLKLIEVTSALAAFADASHHWPQVFATLQEVEKIKDEFDFDEDEQEALDKVADVLCTTLDDINVDRLCKAVSKVVTILIDRHNLSIANERLKEVRSIGNQIFWGSRRFVEIQAAVDGLVGTAESHVAKIQAAEDSFQEAKNAVTAELAAKHAAERDRRNGNGRK